MVTGSDNDDTHVGEALGLYVLGALKGEERDRVERHVAQCADCCIEADALGTAVEPLAMMTPQDLRDVMAEFGDTDRESTS